jgi:hypothetical protein
VNRPVRVLLARAAVLVLLVWSASAHAARATGHPQDGAHADIRLDITGRDVRMNVGLNLTFVDSAAPTRRELADTVDPAEEAAVLEAVRVYLRERNAVNIDGLPVTPVIEELRIDRMDESQLALFPRTGRAALTRFSAVLSYPFKTEPASVTIRWGHYPPSSLAAAIENTAEGAGASHDAGPGPPMLIEAQLKAEGRVKVITFSQSEPEYVWRPSGTEPDDLLEAVPDLRPVGGVAVPVVSGALVLAAGLGCVVLLTRRRVLLGVLVPAPLVLAALGARHLGVVRVGAVSMDERAALSVFTPLHTNVYRAFDYSAEDDIYDALALSVSGDLLADLYGQIRRGLIQAEEGGAIGRVTGVELTEAGLVPGSAGPGGFEIDAGWTVEGTVYHWGHSHAKTTPYAARFGLAPTPAGWRIVRAEPRDMPSEAPARPALPSEL